MQFNFSFDQRVAKQYEAQRAHPDHVSRQIGEAIAAEAGQGASGSARVLEIGVGTGRIARPVAAAGCRVVGFDVSANMLREADAAPQLALLQADMHNLPFVRRSFDAVLAVHVLHLAQDWQKVLTRAAQSLRPGGAFIQGDDWMDPQSVIGQLRDELRRLGMAMSPNMKPPAAGISKGQFLANLGGVEVKEYVAAEWTTQVSPAERLAVIENRMDAESWFLPDKVFDILFGQLNEYAAQTWPNLEEKQVVTRRFVLKVTRGDWRA